MVDPVTVKTDPPDLMKRLNEYPHKMRMVLQETNKASLYVLWENVPPYPAKLPNQRYRRTGTLGRSLGASQTGSKLGQPDMLDQKPLGPLGWSGAFGSNVTYAAEVIGEGTQKPIHQGRWWTMKTIATKSIEKITRLHDKAADSMAKWLDGR